MENAKPSSTPMSVSTRLTTGGVEKFENVSLYRSIVGALQYLTITRPYIAFSVNKAYQFIQAPL